MLQQLYVAGKFDDTRNQAIWEMAINITVSIIATWRFGLIGCLIGTVAALLYRNNALIIYTARRILDRSCLQLYKKIAVNLALGVGIIMLLGTDSCEATSYLHVILTVIPNALWIAAVFICAYQPARVHRICSRTSPPRVTVGCRCDTVRCDAMRYETLRKHFDTRRMMIEI